MLIRGCNDPLILRTITRLDVEASNKLKSTQIKSIQINSFKSIPFRAIESFACLCGCAVVLHPTFAVGIGLDWSLELLTHALDDYEYSDPLLSARSSCRVLQVTDPSRAQDLNKLNHKIAEWFPMFRIWPDEDDFDPAWTVEVPLRRTADTLTLGGVVWTLAFYTGGRLP